jgi:hypothetical protein
MDEIWLVKRIDHDGFTGEVEIELMACSPMGSFHNKRLRFCDRARHDMWTSLMLSGLPFTVDYESLPPATFTMEHA